MPEIGSDFVVIGGCRACGGTDLDLILDLGNMPLADGLVRSGAHRDRELFYPLRLAWCASCSLVQILETVDPETLFGEEYPYYSSFSPSLVEHARHSVERIIDQTGVDEHSFVVEVASNDGYLLQWFAKEGIPVLGIDPAPGPAAAAAERGVPTICDFFTPTLASSLASEGKKADVIIANNVLAHVPDPNQLVSGIDILLAEGGLVVMEFPYVVDLISRSEFDTIYHEHHCYFSVTSVQNLFRRHGLELVRVEHLEIHGGSLRVFFSRSGPVDASVESFLSAELEMGVHRSEFYEALAENAEEIRVRLRDLLHQIKREGKSVAAYGAAAKGATLLNFCDLGRDELAYVVDRNHHKQGWEMPGVSIPIASPDLLREETPDYLLVLAWNFEEEIARQQSWFLEQGGRFIVPIPAPTIR